MCKSQASLLILSCARARLRRANETKQRAVYARIQFPFFLSSPPPLLPLLEEHLPPWSPWEDPKRRTFLGTAATRRKARVNAEDCVGHGVVCGVVECERGACCCTNKGKGKEKQEERGGSACALPNYFGRTMISGGLLEKMKRLPLPVWCVWCACRGGSVRQRGMHQTHVGGDEQAVVLGSGASRIFRQAKRTLPQAPQIPPWKSRWWSIGIGRGVAW